MLDRPSLFVAGEWRKPVDGGALTVVSPSTGEAVATAAAAGPADAGVALAAARRVVEDGEWGRLPVSDRVAVVRAMAKNLEPEVEEILHVVTYEMGVPVRVSRVLHGQKALESIYQACDAAEQVAWSEQRPGSTPAVVHQEPVGVVVGI